MMAFCTDKWKLLNNIKYYFLMLFLLVIAVASYAQDGAIKITDVKFPSSGTSKNGEIEILAQGTAGEFLILLESAPCDLSDAYPDPLPLKVEIDGENVTSHRYIKLCSGNYVFQIANKYGCITTIDFYLPVCEPLEEQDLQADITKSCVGSNTGDIDLSVLSSGVFSYDYSWSNGRIGQDIINVSSGSYTVTVTNISCPSVAPQEKTFNVGSLPDFSIQLTDLDNSCATDVNAGDGSIDISVTGAGAVGLSYQWSNGASSQDINGLAPGTYSVTVTNNDGCQKVGGPYEIIGTNTFIGIPGDIINACQPEGRLGSISLTPFGGTAPYSYSWNTGATNQMLENVAGGTYNVTVTDDNKCVATQSFTVEESVLEVIVADISYPSNPNIAGGHIDLEINQASHLPMSYNWTSSTDPSFSSTQQDISTLPEGDYFVTVTDQLGCTFTQEIEVLNCSPNENPDFNTPVSIDQVNLTTLDVSTGSIVPILSGGRYPQYYHWEGPNGFEVNTLSVNDLAEGEYHFTVTDGCTSASMSRLLVDCEEYDFEVDISSCDFCNVNWVPAFDRSGKFEVEVNNSYGPISFEWSENINGQWLDYEPTSQTFNKSSVEVSGAHSSYQLTLVVSDLTTC